MRDMCTVEWFMRIAAFVFHCLRRFTIHHSYPHHGWAFESGLNNKDKVVSIITFFSNATASPTGTKENDEKE